MTERKRRKLGEIDQQISVCKANLSLSEGKIIGSMTRSSPTADSRMSTPPKDTGSSNDEVILFIKHLTKLRDVLEEKNALLESESDRSVAVLENEVARLSGEAKQAQEWERAAKEREEQVKVLKERVGELEGRLQQRLQEGEEQLRHYKQENTEIKLQNRSLKADNKVIMNHLDRLTREIKEGPTPKTNSLEERELRVMRSLYQETLPNIELRESHRRVTELEEPRHRIAAEEAVDRNGELKAVIRRLQEEIDVLRREKELLLEQNRQKHLNLESQRQLVAMVQEEKTRQDSLIRKMGDKIMSLEEISQTLRESASKEDSETEANYYRTTRTKAGQFYYRK